MVQMDPIDRLTRAALASDEEFVTTLNDLLHHDLRISIRELSEKSGIAQSLALQDNAWKAVPQLVHITGDHPRPAPSVPYH